MFVYPFHAVGANSDRKLFGNDDELYRSMIEAEFMRPSGDPIFRAKVVPLEPQT